MEFATLSSDISGDSKLNEKEKKNYIVWIDVLKHKPPQDIQSETIYSLYTNIPPVRNDYRLLKIKFGKYKKEDILALDKENNYYLKDAGLLVFKRYKTDHEYETKTINLKQPDQKYRAYSKVKKALDDITHENSGGWTYQDDDLIFPKGDDDEYISSEWTTIVQKVFSVGKRRKSGHLRN